MPSTQDLSVEVTFTGDAADAIDAAFASSGFDRYDLFIADLATSAARSHKK